MVTEKEYVEKVLAALPAEGKKEKSLPEIMATLTELFDMAANLEEPKDKGGCK